MNWMKRYWYNLRIKNNPLKRIIFLFKKTRNKLIFAYNQTYFYYIYKKRMYNHKEIEAKWQAFGWEVLSMDGHDFDSLRSTLTAAKAKTGQGEPIVIIMKTEMGQGVDYMIGSHKWHGVAPNAEQLEKALLQLEETLGDY